jgi:hypothetical protein
VVLVDNDIDVCHTRRPHQAVSTYEFAMRGIELWVLGSHSGGATLSAIVVSVVCELMAKESNSENGCCCSHS